MSNFSLAKMTSRVSRDRCVAPCGKNISGVSIFGRIEWCGKYQAPDCFLCQWFSGVAKLRGSREGLAEEEAEINQTSYCLSHMGSVLLVPN